MTHTFIAERPSTQPPGPSAIARWSTDWNLWKDSSAAEKAVLRWRKESTLIRPLATATDIVDGAGDDRTVPDGLANSRLLFLVTQAAAGDTAAGRVVLARIVPGLVAMAARRATSGHGLLDELFEDYLGGAWMATAGYPTGRRTRNVAANLLHDTERLVRGRRSTLERRTVICQPDDLPYLGSRIADPDSDRAAEPLLDLLELLRDARAGGLSEASLTLLVDLGVHGWDVPALAARDGVVERTVRWRRSRALRELRWLLGRDPATGRHRTSEDGWIPSSPNTAAARGAA